MRVPSPSRRPAAPATRVLVVVVLACLLATSACGGGEDRSAATPPVDSSTSPTPSQPTATAEASSPAASPSPTPASLTDVLLPTSEVPGLNAHWTWQDGETGPAGTQPFGLCAKADLLSIGATEVVERSYFPPDDSDDSAAEQVADFPDETTASTAWTVLKAWHDRCKAAPDGTDVATRPMQTVPVGAGAARWYLLSWQPADDEAGRFEGLGMVRSGTRIAVVRIDHSGPDHDYAPGHDPTIAMVEAAAARLG